MHFYLMEIICDSQTNLRNSAEQQTTVKNFIIASQATAALKKTNCTI